METAPGHNEKHKERMQFTRNSWQIFSHPETLLVWVQKEKGTERYAFCIARENVECTAILPLAYTQYIFPSFEDATNTVEQLLKLVVKKYIRRLNEPAPDFLSYETVGWIMNEVRLHRTAQTAGTKIAHEANKYFEAFLASRT